MTNPSEFYEIFPHISADDTVMIALYKFKTNIQGYAVFKIPYLESVFWTHYKYNDSDNNDNVSSKIILNTFNGFNYTFKASRKNQSNAWITTEWPIPPLNMSKSSLHIILEHHALPHDTSLPQQLILHGIKRLFPKKDNYILVSSRNIPEFVFTYYDDTETGEIYNIENQNAIHDTITNFHEIQTIDKY
jgi:hypothetical protein